MSNSKLDKQINELCSAEAAIEASIDMEEDNIRQLEGHREYLKSELEEGNVDQEFYDSNMSELDESEKFFNERVKALKLPNVKEFIQDAYKQGLQRGCDKEGVSLKTVVEFGVKLNILQDAGYYAGECITEVLDNISDSKKLN